MQFSSFLFGFIADEAKSWTVEELSPVAKVPAGASFILELLPLMLLLAAYSTEKVNSVQSDRDKKTERKGEARIDLKELILQHQKALEFRLSLSVMVLLQTKSNTKGELNEVTSSSCTQLALTQ